MIVFLAANEEKLIWWKQYQNETATTQQQDTVTINDAVARKIDTQNNITRAGHQRDKEERATTSTTAQNTGTGHQKYREKRAITVTTACNGYAF